MTQITDAMLKEWEGLCEKATPGEWKSMGMGGDSFVMAPTHKWNKPTFREMCPIALPRSYQGESGVTHVDYSSAGFAHDDARFIAAARTALPQLIAEVRRLRGEKS